MALTLSKEKIKSWLKDRHNAIFLGILLFAIFIRLYYWLLTKTQALWWDEADYLAYAKNLAGFPTDWIVTAKHNSLYPYLVSVFFKIGASEMFTKFFLQVIPSILSVVLVYLLANQMYSDKRIGIIASAVMSVFWVSLFNTARFHIDILALFLGLLTCYIFWVGYEKKNKIFGKLDPKWTIPLTVLLVILTYSIRRGYFLIGLFIFLYMILTTKFSQIVKNKYNWIGLIGGAVVFLLVENTIFQSGITSVSEGYYHTEYPIAFAPLRIFSDFFLNIGSQTGYILFILFWVGFLVACANLVLSAGYINKSTLKTKSDLFNIISIVSTLVFFMVVLRTPGTPGEARWYLPIALASFIFISQSAVWILDSLKKYHKYIALAVVLILIAVSAYGQIKYSDATVRHSLNSFEGIKEAGLYIKDNSYTYDQVLTVPAPQIAYYSERSAIRPAQWIGWNGSNDDIPQDEIFDKIRESPLVRYLVVSFSEPNHPLWMKTITSAQKPNGEEILVTWEIPFMDTKINFITDAQDIKQTKTYGDITFKLAAIRNEVFVYEIIRG